MHSYHGKNPYVFFSYCHEDQKEVFEIAEKMYDMRYRVWYDKALEAGKPFDDDIADHIKACDVFIIFLSKHYLDSPYCDMELKFAVENERKCFAIYLDNVDLSNHSGMAMCLRTSNNIYRKKLSEKEFDEMLLHTSFLDDCKRKEDEDDTDLSIRETLLPASFSSWLCVFLIYIATAISYILRSIAHDDLPIYIGKTNVATTGIAITINILILIISALMLYQFDKKYAHFTDENSAFSNYIYGLIVLNFDFAVIPLADPKSIIGQILYGGLLFFITMLPMTVSFERKTLPCSSINYMNTVGSHQISIFLIVLVYGETCRWTLFILLLFMYLYIMLAEMDRKSEKQADQKIIRILSVEGNILNTALILFLLIRFLFDMILRLSQTYFDTINHIYFDYLPQYLK